jgi:hypothetical protein
LFKGGAAILADSQNGDIIVLSITMTKRVTQGRLRKFT